MESAEHFTQDKVINSQHAQPETLASTH